MPEFPKKARGEETAGRAAGSDVGATGKTGALFLVLDRTPDGVTAQRLTAAGVAEASPERVAELPDYLRAVAGERRRVVWDSTAKWYPPLLGVGVRVERAVDLRLAHAILRRSTLLAGTAYANAPSDEWDAHTADEKPADGLFELEAVPIEAADPAAEFRRQREAMTLSGEMARLGLLVSIESAGALAAVEMAHDGLPWRRDVHERILADALGPRPAPGARPARMGELLTRMRVAVGADLNPDSPPELLKALRAAGLAVESTRSAELARVRHPVVPPLLEYKKLARLCSANGWLWLDENVRDGRFHPQYVPGGVVTGRWASRGGGALQLPKQVRGAVVADPGWKLVVADAAQLEPRILGAMSADRDMVAAGNAGDLYASIAATGAVRSRDEATVAMLGAMYGATSGRSGQLLPALERRFGRAIAFVEEAARVGEQGGVVTTLLGRSSPTAPDVRYDETATDAERARDRERRRAWGRFTRNFVVQGTAAEWALAWMASVRGRLAAIDATRAGRPHLVFFLHDELVVHTPEPLADDVRDAMSRAATDAGTLLFGTIPVTFPLSIAVVDDYSSAK